jgi:pimeloyl-ACP methyl ester carboxylesterase
VAGRFDQVRPSAASEQFARTIPDARFELIDGVHMMPAQASGPLLALLQDFLGAQVAPAARRAKG